MRKSGSPCTWDTDDTSTTCGKDPGLLLPGLSLLPAQGKAQTFPPVPGHCSLQPLSLQIGSNSAGKPRRRVPQPQGGSPPRRAAAWAAGEATGKLGFPGDLLSVSFHHAMIAPSRSCCRVAAAAPPWEDPSSTQVHGSPAWLGPAPSSEELIPIPSSALAHSVWSLTDPRAVAAPIHPSPSQQGARHPQKACPCVSTPALLMPWLPGCTYPWEQAARQHTLGPGSKGRG